MQNIKIYEIPTVDYVEKIDDPRVGMIFYIADIDMYYSVKALKEINSYNTKGDKVVEYIISDYAEFGSGSGGGSGLTAQQLANIAKIPVIQSTVDGLPNNYAAKAHTHSGYANNSHRHDASEIDNLPSGGNGGSTTIVDNLNSTSATSALSANQGRVIKSSLDNITTRIDGVNFNNIPITITQAEYDLLEESEKIDKVFIITDSEAQVIEGHTHDNKTVLDAITQSKVDEWNKNAVDIANILLRLSALENGEEPPVIEQFGEIVLNKTSTTITEGGTDTFTVSLDKAPTNDQVVTLSSNNADITLDKTSLTFTPSNYNTAQTVNISVVEDDDYSNETCTITLISPNVTSKTLLVNVNDNDQEGSGDGAIIIDLSKDVIGLKDLVYESSGDCLVYSGEATNNYPELNFNGILEADKTYKISILTVENTLNSPVEDRTASHISRIPVQYIPQCDPIPANTVQDYVRIYKALSEPEFTNRINNYAIRLFMKNSTSGVFKFKIKIENIN